MMFIYGRREDILVGQGDNCGIRISDSSSYDEEVLAYIVPDSEVKSWRLIRGDEAVCILVNGEPLRLVHYLNAGDRIIFGNDKTVYRFAGAQPEDTGTAISALRRFVAVSVAAVIVLMSLFAGLFLRPDPEDDIRRSELRRYESSLYKISVKEVIYQSVTFEEQGVAYDTIGKISLDTSIPAGTCFLCTDGKLVTARHCIEPWIVREYPDLCYDKADTLVIWAAEAETYNIRHRKDECPSYRRLISVCEIFRNGYLQGHISSDTCFFSMRNDIVRNLRGVNEPLYWRELGHIRSRSSLGDIAYFNTGYKGEIQIADEAYIDSLLVDIPAAHIGYPAGHSEAGFERSRLSIRRQKDRCLEFKDTDVGKGYSGGPVMVRHNGRLCAVGVLSRVFDVNQRRCVCVPVSEIAKAERRWEE